MKLILIRCPQLLFYKMKSKKEDKNMTTDTITISYNYDVKRKYTIREKKLQEKLILKHICKKTTNNCYRRTTQVLS